MIPWREARSTILTELARQPRFGVISDVDGTLSPIVDVPEEAAVTERARAALHELQGSLPLVAVVSGRGAADVFERVAIPGLVAVGNHGLERWTGEGPALDPRAVPYRPALIAAAEAIRPLLEPGMTLEDKGPTLTVHYRRAERPQETAVRLAPQISAIAAAEGLRVHDGRMIFELRPPLDLHKGTAFADLVAEFNLGAALYLGDDTTDVDALGTARRLREAGDCLAYGVGVWSPGGPPSVASAADLLATDVADVEDLLEWLAAAVSASRT